MIKNRISFAFNGPDSPKGKIARREVQIIDRENRRALQNVQQLIEAAKKTYKFLEKYKSEFDDNGARDIKRLVKLLKDYDDEYGSRVGFEGVLEDIAFFRDLGT